MAAMLSTLEVVHLLWIIGAEKLRVRIKGIFVPILNLNLRQVEEMR
jgi:hypothetical protein